MVSPMQIREMEGLTTNKLVIIEHCNNRERAGRSVNMRPWKLTLLRPAGRRKIPRLIQFLSNAISSDPSTLLISLLLMIWSLWYCRKPGKEWEIGRNAAKYTEIVLSMCPSLTYRLASARWLALPGSGPLLATLFRDIDRNISRTRSAIETPTPQTSVCYIWLLRKRLVKENAM